MPSGTPRLKYALPNQDAPLPTPFSKPCHSLSIVAANTPIFRNHPSRSQLGHTIARGRQAS